MLCHRGWMQCSKQKVAVNYSVILSVFNTVHICRVAFPYLVYCNNPPPSGVLFKIAFGFVFHFSSVSAIPACHLHSNPPLFAWKAILISSITVFWLSVQCVYTSPFCTLLSQIYPENVRRMRREGWIELWRKQTNTFWRRVPSFGVSCYKHKEHRTEEAWNGNACSEFQ